MSYSGRIARLVLLILLLLVFVALYQILPPFDFPVGTVVRIPAGATAIEVANQFAEAKLVRSKRAFSWLLRHNGGTRVVAGLYEFERPLSVRSVARRVSDGVFTAAPIKITLPEGLNNEEMAKRLAEKLPNFDPDLFVGLAWELQGQLFPETYFFVPHVNTEEVINILREGFKNQTKDLTLGSREINLAAIVEEEVSDPTDRRLIAGILLKRLEAGRHLQVDVATSTYEHIGLPPRPIVNPSLDAILAVLEATSSPYWYYLSDESGTTHYAKTFDQHRQNIDTYLR